MILYQWREIVIKLLRSRFPKNLESRSKVTIVKESDMSLRGHELSDLNWRKAQLSISNGACVEVASVAESVFVRDSKDPHGLVLRYPASSWQSFSSAARRGEFDSTS